MMRLSPTTRWYICRLLQSHPEVMGEDVQPGELLKSGTVDVNQFLDRLLASDANIAARIPEIERLAQIHQGLSTQGNHFLSDVTKMEAQVFTLLGLKFPNQNSQTSEEKLAYTLTATDQAEVDQPLLEPEPKGVSVMTYLATLNQLSQLGKKYLGAHIVVNYWQTSRPPHAWLEEFKVQSSGDVQWLGSVDLVLTAAQEQILQQWIVKFINRCTQVIRNFAQLVEQTELLSQVLS